MASNTRSRMIEGAAELMCVQGINGTSVRGVVHHTQTPRGSIAFHFPGGKLEMLQEALSLADQHISNPLRLLLQEKGTVNGLKAFIDTWRHRLKASDFLAGCPILAAAVEPYVAEKVDASSSSSNAPVQPLRAMAYEAFTGWQELIAQSLKRDGFAPARSRRVAALVVAAVEGGIALSRAARDLRPLDDVSSELEWLIKAALPVDNKLRG